jgi:hypothetical protein
MSGKVDCVVHPAYFTSVCGYGMSVYAIYQVCVSFHQRIHDQSDPVYEQLGHCVQCSRVRIVWSARPFGYVASYGYVGKTTTTIPSAKRHSHFVVPSISFFPDELLF